MSTQHLPFSQLADIAEGRSTPDEMARNHLRACPACAGDLAWLVHVIGVMRTMSSEASPSAAVARVKALFREQQAAPGARNLLRAILHFDSSHATPAFGLRSGAALERQLLLSASSYEIDLRIANSGGRWVVSGQLLGDLATGGHVELLGATDMASAELNELHEFVLPSVCAGIYNLTLSFGERTIVVPGLELGG